MESTREFIARKNAEFEKMKECEMGIGMKDIGRKGRHQYIREAWSFLPASNLKDHKVFLFERLRWVSNTGRLAYKKSNFGGQQEYRIGYFIVGRIGRAKGRWIWGQFCPIIPIKDLDRLLKKAKKDRVILK